MITCLSRHNVTPQTSGEINKTFLETIDTHELGGVAEGIKDNKHIGEKKKKVPSFYDKAVRLSPFFCVSAQSQQCYSKANDLI